MAFSLYEQALTHRSYAHEKHCASYERLEFLGDAVLELIVSDYLYKAFPEADEGLLSQKRAELVCEKALADKAALLGLGDKARIGKSLTEDYRQNTGLLCDLIEARIGAIYLDQGLEAAQDFVNKHILAVS